MSKKRYAIITLMLAVILATGAFSGCNSCVWTDKETEPTSGVDSTTMMPGYVDDGTTAQNVAQPEENSTKKPFVPSGPFKDGDNSGYADSDNNDTLSKVDASQGDNRETVSQQNSQITEAVTSVTDSAEETQEKADNTYATANSEAEEQNTTEAEATEPSDEVISTDATEKSTAAEDIPADKPEYPVPGVPDDDIIGPLPPIDMDEFLDPDATIATAVTNVTEEKSESSSVASTSDKTGATVFTQEPSVTDSPYIPEISETAATAVTTKPTSTTENVKPTVATEATNPTDPSGRLEFSYYGSFTGEFVEDGTDEYVQNVAIIFVTNISESYLEYAVFTFDIDGKVAAFTATGLAPGESAWVLEQNRLKVEKGAEFRFVDDVSSFTKYVSPAETEVKVTLGEGQLKVRNTSGKDLKDVYVYYKQVHTDGNFLGGITYRVSVGDMKSGEEIDCVAMHSSPKSSRVVSVTYREEAN